MYSRKLSDLDFGAAQDLKAPSVFLSEILITDINYHVFITCLIIWCFLYLKVFKNFFF